MVKQQKKKKPAKAKQTVKKTLKKRTLPKKSAPKAAKKSSREATAKKKPSKEQPVAKTRRPSTFKPPAVTAPTPVAVVTTAEPQPVPLEPPPPARAPVRKIIGTDRTITVVPRPAERPSEQSQTRDVPPPQLPSVSSELKLAEAPPALTLAPAPEPTYDWDSVPEYVPAEVRFSIKNAIKECEAASAWPLPLAKFFASLPSEICGLQFAMMLMNLSQTAEEIAHVCGKPVERILSLLETAQTNLQEKFSTKCGEIYRRWRLQLSGRGADSAELIAHHSISQVDRDWQVTVANVILKAMGGEHFANDGTAHPNRWWLNPAHAQQAGS
jgi:hypothetical protein